MDEREMYTALTQALDEFLSWRARMSEDCRSADAKRILKMIDYNLFDVKHNVKMLERHLDS